jgi:hypothetical protein
LSLWLNNFGFGSFSTIGYWFECYMYYKKSKLHVIAIEFSNLII